MKAFLRCGLGQARRAYRKAAADLAAERVHVAYPVYEDGFRYTAGADPVHREQGVNVRAKSISTQAQNLRTRMEAAAAQSNATAAEKFNLWVWDIAADNMKRAQEAMATKST
jgi:hypothetical protein